ncbi:MAG TPA: tRNA uracil 4-sulfurtransferase ThiI [Polyangia bacterium]|nr:tRNA uracil 4-sulfurtransferase ThiI [Polyangia bacterium]
MATQDGGVILCRYGELFLKSGNRRRFERVLCDNIRSAVADLPNAQVTSTHGRTLVKVQPADVDAAVGRLERVFGLVSFSVARRVSADAELEAIGAAAVEAAEAAIARDRPVSFKVESRRGDKRFPVTSLEISRRIGARVQAATGLKVDVHTPALTIGVEVATGHAFVYAGTRASPGGLPVGASGRALLLLSGGIDSPVAGWLAAKRGLALDAVYFHSPPYVGEKSRDKVLTLGRKLARWQALRSVTVVPFTEVQKRLRDAGPGELAVVLYRRMMMRIADAVADKLDATALVTGENLGQVASQTIDNLGTIEEAARRIVLRPLLTYDKVETTALAQRIGTYETSILPFDDCCSLFVPAHPATRARVEDAAKAEAKLDLTAEVAAAVAASERVSIV